MIDELAFPSALWNEMMRHLIRNEKSPSRANEQLAFAFCTPSLTEAGQSRLIIQDLLLADESDFDHQSPGGLRPNASFVARALTECRRTGRGLLEVHSHPFDTSSSTTFSGIDWRNDRAKMPGLTSILPSSAFHATMVVGQSSFDAHYYDRDTARIVGIPSIVAVGANGERLNVERKYASSHDAVAHSALEVDERFARQIPLFGNVTQSRLSQAAVSVVGLGGLGSFVAQELALLGVGRLVLIDPDDIDATSLNRLIGATSLDVGRPKVEVFAELIHQINPSADVVTNRESILTSQSIDLVKGSDLIAGCVDNHGARLVLNRLATQYILPYVDAGTGMRESAQSGEWQIGGQVQVVMPGLGCLECRGSIDQSRAAYDLGSAAAREYERERGYGSGSPAPSVVHLNGVVASLQVALASQLLTSHARPVTASAATLFDGNLLRTTLVQLGPDLDCVTCGRNGVLGSGDLLPVFEQAGDDVAPIPEKVSDDEAPQGLISGPNS